MKENKITDNEMNSGVIAAPTTLTDTAQGNKAVFDRLPKLIAKKYNDFVDAVIAKFGEYYTAKKTEERIAETMENIGAGDMSKTEYAVAEEPGTVKNAKQFDGHNVEEFMAKANFEFDADTQTLNITL